MRLILFDCDGTIVDSQHIIVAAMERAFARFERPAPTRSATLGIVGLSLPQAIAELTAPDDPDIDGLVGAYKNAFHDLRAEADILEPLYPGARAAIEALKRRGDTVLGIATGKSQRGVRLVLGHHGLYDAFTTIQTADDAPSKPHPGMVLQGMAACGVGPQDTVMIGDTAFDMAMARAAGARAIGVAWGYHSVDRMRQAGADAIAEDYEALMDLIEADR